MPIRPPTVQLAAHQVSTAQRDYDRTRRADTPALAAAARLRGSAAWQRLRAHFIVRHPVCGVCGAALAKQVHHLQPVEKHPELAMDWENLAPVCTACHASCNARESAGSETASLFTNFKRRPAFGG